MSTTVDAADAPPGASSGSGTSAAAGAVTPPDQAEARPPGAHRGRWLVAAVVLLVVAVGASLALGARPVALGTVVDAFVRPDGSDAQSVVLDLRLPRTVLGLLVGVSLGLSGALIQALTRNPLADPGILGVNAGAQLAVVLGATAGVVTLRGQLWLAFAGAAAATLAVYAIGAAGRGRPSPLRLTLAGVALGAALGGVTSGLTLVSERTYDTMRVWGVGSLAARDLGVAATIAPFVAVGVLVALAVARPLNAVALGDDTAATLGARLGATRVAVVVAVTLLAGAATAAAGPVGFVGLMVPHVARWLTGPDQRWVLTLTMLLAPVLVLVSDVTGRLVMRPAELPVGIVTAFVGAPVLVALVRRHRASGL
ncbi:iron chelate uptake ABC transporter family permease subunit [Cellulomonas sp. HD19AZ1]|uniref:iron chelate uptake ABC transporter family permease subunit n=1 Tax=Cellulomonas TaxID=1707 RepID=UPI001070D81F|nr:iron chelate uptake ABC transporter family permease subunit [Cellulomonas sp. HD19AZ1]TFH72061.1 Fe(3+)-siderophore ABC transporter permease [Cellulomonas sp. HD19AZ1]